MCSFTVVNPDYPHDFDDLVYDIVGEDGAIVARATALGANLANSMQKDGIGLMDVLSVLEKASSYMKLIERT